MLSDLQLKHFRSYTDESFEFDPGVNIIVGPNASGKTNLLEAVLVLARGGSYRAQDADLIQFDEPWARLDSTLAGGTVRTVKIMTEPHLNKRYELDGKPYARLSLRHTLPVVLFEPNHLRLLSGSPEQRRSYMDDVLEQIRPGFSTLRRQYKRTLAQRNALLKQGANVTSTKMFPWNIRLSQLAGQIVQARCELVNNINRELPELYSSLSRAKTDARLCYVADWPADGYESALLRKLEAATELEKLRGYTAHGPHREDFTVEFNGRPATETASRGEVRTLVLALKIVELQMVADARETTPLLLLDDVFSELDGSRRRALTEFLKDYQTFITTTDADIVVQHFTETCRVLPLGG